ncbi:hypothetical protein NQ317_013730 [Molorchus minor]|uniref:Exonuclease domain-containing protein n=1 Tax=Molorchus minor TaxID=1323400 RepID=A0ABQ9JP20_9CUCU|nr:hypothetical protein NQ317_013730 [Molorchus minor]
MDGVLESLLKNPTVITGLFVGVSVLILVYIAKLVRTGDVIDPKIAKNEKSSHPDRKKDSSHVKSKKKVVDNRWAGRNEKQTYTHPWLLTSLKGHTSSILDMNFSSNGKYLTSCGDEDPDPGGLREPESSSSSSSSSSSEYNKEDSGPPSGEASPQGKGLSRRQRKNRKREDSPSEKKKQRSRRFEPVPPLTKKRVMAVVPLKQCLKFNASERVFVGLLNNYVLTYEEMILLGYPVEASHGKVEIQKCPQNRFPSIHITPRHKFDVNAREFVPKQGWISGDSGRGSGSSSDSGDTCDSEESSSSSEREYVLNKDKVENFVKRMCSRCSKFFFVSENEYLIQERCIYHWGRIRSTFTDGEERLEYSCCNGKTNSRGCSYSRVHVWDGLTSGINGPFHDYVRTRPRKTPPADGNYGVYAIDCEMCYTVRGLECTKVTVVGMDGRLVYDSFVKPDREILDYNTRFSGISQKDLSRKGATKTLREVQNDLMGFINANTILIGHGLENDLRALKIVHNTVVDTTFCYPHYNGLPYKRSLRSLTATYLKREIQCGSNGHNSYEDASACMELMLWRLRKDFKNRAVFIWDTKDLTQKDRRSLRINIEFDYATMVKWSPDSKAFIINRYNENALEVYKVEKKKDGWLQATKALTFPKAHETDIIGMGIASSGKFIMSCSNKTDMVIWNLKGQKLAQIDTYLMNTTCAKLSPCGRFVVASGFTPEARVWEVTFNKEGAFQDVKQVKELTLGGHSSGVYDVTFDVDSSHMATVSKDGTWKLFDTKVSYKLGEDARIIRSGKYEQASSNALIALSPDAQVIVIATFNSLAFYSTFNGKLDYVIENIYTGPITCILFDSTGKYLLTAGDKQIRVFHNVTGYRCSIETAREKLKESQTSATKERLQKLIVDSQAFLELIEKK